ncbi:MAG: flagellar filament capping protein FliD [Nocardioidaceae bacterium]
MQATATGAAGSFTLTDSTGAALLGGATVVQGADAAVTIGADTVHSSTNTFSGVMTGLDFTVSSAAVGQTATLTVSSDSSTANTKVKAFVDAVNGVLSQIDSLTAYNSTTNTSGTLAGESVLREVRSNLVNAVYPNDGSSLADIGLQTDKYGKARLRQRQVRGGAQGQPRRRRCAVHRRRHGGLRQPGQDRRERRERLHDRHAHRLGHGPQLVDHEAAEEHRRLDRPARPASHVPHPAVHGHGDGAVQPPVPGELALQPDLGTQQQQQHG